MPKTNFVVAYSKRTGRKQTIPKHWLEINRPPFNDFRLTPEQRTKTTPVEAGNKKKEAN